MNMTIGIIGLGTVGQALAKAFGQVKGLDILLYDKYRNIMYKSSQAAREDIRKKCDIIFICVPTPTKLNGDQDLSELDEVMEWLHPKEKSNQIIIIKSTVLPGTTWHYRKKYGDDFIAPMPEFLDEKTALADVIKPRRTPILGALYDEHIVYKVENLFNLIWKDVNIIIVRPTHAELIKYFTNCYYALKCMFARQIQEIIMKDNDPSITRVLEVFSDNPRVGKDHWKVMEKGKFSLGGKCLPKDLRAFEKWSRDKCTDVVTFTDGDGIEVKMNIFNFIRRLDNEYRKKDGFGFRD
ncbi:MAG: hypothetical protein DRI44_02555 [Chlamydiae bacterium]|nr:MAG: hypothetical protein DRI44_02555 [Chlamydiota bacterium]